MVLKNKVVRAVVFGGVVFTMLTLGSLALAGCMFSSPKLAEQKITTSTPTFTDHQRIKIQLGDSPEIEVEVVNSEDSIIQGLSGRTEIGADGMLFIFSESQTPRFWMKEMKFDLDMIWIKNWTVVDITEQVPAPEPSTPLNKLPLYQPNQSVDMILEVPAGSVEKWRLKTGDQILLK
jgi:uncharacterized protein